MPEVSIGASYGAYLVVIGGILAILVTLGLKEEKVVKRITRRLSRKKKIR